jgi:hypothetical protein
MTDFETTIMLDMFHHLRCEIMYKTFRELAVLSSSWFYYTDISFCFSYFYFKIKCLMSRIFLFGIQAPPLTLK